MKKTVLCCILPSSVEQICYPGYVYLDLLHSFVQNQFLRNEFRKPEQMDYADGFNDEKITPAHLPGLEKRFITFLS